MFLFSSKSSLDYTGKIIFNNLENYVISLIKIICKSQAINTNDIINKNHIKKSINKITENLDKNMCINQMIKSQCM